MLGCTRRAAASASRRKRETNWSVVGEVLGQQLDRDLALQAPVEGADDGRHAADAQAARRARSGPRAISPAIMATVTPPRVPPVPVSVPVVVPASGPVGVVPVGAVVVAVSVRSASSRSCRSSVGRSSSVVVCVVVGAVSVCVCVRLVCAWPHVARDRGGEVARCPRCRRSRRRASTDVGQRRDRVLGLGRARCAAPTQSPASVVATRRWSSAVVRLVGVGSPGSAPSRRRRRRRAAAVAAPSSERERASGRTRILIDRTPGARRGSPAGARRGSRPRRRRCRTRCAASAASRRSVSSSSQAARGSPSRGWPTLPGLSSHSPSATSTLVAAAARRAGRRLALGAHRRTARRASGRRAPDALGLGVEAQLGQQRARGRTPRPGRAGYAW